VNYPISKEDWASSAESAYREIVPYRSHILIYPKALLSTVPAVDKSIVANNRYKVKAFIPTAKDHWDFC
jgi:hypothetical protein